MTRDTITFDKQPFHYQLERDYESVKHVLDELHIHLPPIIGPTVDFGDTLKYFKSPDEIEPAQREAVEQYLQHYHYVWAYSNLGKALCDNNPGVFESSEQASSIASEYKLSLYIECAKKRIGQSEPVIRELGPARFIKMNQSSFAKLERNFQATETKCSIRVKEEFEQLYQQRRSEIQSGKYDDDWKRYVASQPAIWDCSDTTGQSAREVAASVVGGIIRAHDKLAVEDLERKFQQEYPHLVDIAKHFDCSADPKMNAFQREIAGKLFA